MPVSIVRRGSVLVAGTALLCAALAACSASPTASGGLLSITTDRAEYRSGSSGTATAVNVSGAPVQYNFCEAEVQRRTPARWVTVGHSPSDPGFTCVAALFALQPGASATISFMLPAGLSGGVYRLRFGDVYPPDASRPAPHATQPFHVEPGTVLL